MEYYYPTPAWERQSTSQSTPTTPAETPMSKMCKKPRERWTNEEHERFLEGIKRFHRDWRAIERHVGTKTAVQIRSHAQKFFAKAEKVPGTVDFALPPPRPKRKPATPCAPCATGHSGQPCNPTTTYTNNPSTTTPGTTPSGDANQCILSSLLGDSPPDGAQGSMPPEGPADMMNKIAAAAIAAASTTAHAVINAAGPEYLQVINELARHDERLRFLSFPLPQLLSSVAPASTAPLPDPIAPATSHACTHSAALPLPTQPLPPLSRPVVSGVWTATPAPPAQSHLWSFLANGPLSSLSAVAPLQPGVQQAQLRTPDTPLGPIVPSIAALSGHNVQRCNQLLFVPPESQLMADSYRTDGPRAASSQEARPSAAAAQPSTAPVSSKAARQCPATTARSLANAPTPAAEAHMAQQQAAQAQQQGDAQLSGFGQQGSRGGSGLGNDSGGSARGSGKNNGSGDRSGSKSAKQSDNLVNQQMAAAALPTCPTQAGLTLLENREAMSSEFYTEYYMEMIRRGTEGLRNVKEGKLPPLDTWPPLLLEQQVALTAAAADKEPQGEPAADAAEEGCKHVKAAVRTVGAKAAAEQTLLKPSRKVAKVTSASLAMNSIGCKQPADLIGAVMEPTTAFIREAHWQMEVDQQDTATSAQGAQELSRDAVSTQRDSSVRMHLPSKRTTCPERTFERTLVTGPFNNPLDGSDGGSNEPVEHLPCLAKEEEAGRLQESPTPLVPAGCPGSGSGDCNKQSEESPCTAVASVTDARDAVKASTTLDAPAPHAT